MPVVYGEDTPKLGFGLMRLPKRGFVINVEQVKTMVDLFLDAGFTYFDTAYVYPGSETAIRKATVRPTALSAASARASARSICRLPTI